VKQVREHKSSPGWEAEQLKMSQISGISFDALEEALVKSTQVLRETPHIGWCSPVVQHK
jgi:hypothetical protein